MTPVEERIDHEALRLLNEICLDSLESPLSHVDDPEADGGVTDLFRRLKAEIVALLTEHSAREERIGKLENLCVDLEGIALRDADTIARLLKSAARRIAVTKEPPCQ